MSTETRLTDPKTGGQKGMKPERFDLIPFDALEEVARVYGFGAAKYEDNNWLRGYPWLWSAGALMRHVGKWMLCEDRDGESGLHHLAHAAWHCLTLITFQLRKLGTDTRPKVNRVCWTQEGLDSAVRLVRDVGTDDAARLLGLSNEEIQNVCRFNGPRPL